MDLRAGPSTAEGGTRSRPLRGKVLARHSSSRANDDDRLRIPPTSPAHKSETGKKESTARLLNRRCRRSATPSSTSSCDQVLSDVRTADPGSARKSSISKSAKVVLGLVAEASPPGTWQMTAVIGRARRAAFFPNAAFPRTALQRWQITSARRPGFPYLVRAGPGISARRS